MCQGLGEAGGRTMGEKRRNMYYYFKQKHNI